MTVKINAGLNNQYFNVYFIGFDEYLAHHFAYLFIRDPLQLFEEKLHQDPENENDHFEVCLQLTWIHKFFMLNQKCIRSVYFIPCNK